MSSADANDDRGRRRSRAHPADPPTPLRRWLKRIAWAVGLFLLYAILVHGGDWLLRTSSRLELGPETTVISAPVDADGFPDYVAALNAARSAGVKPEQNVAAALVRILGPAAVPQGGGEYFLRELGIGPLPAAGDYWRGPGEFIQTSPQTTAERQFSVRTEDARDKAVREATRRPWTEDMHPDVGQWLKANAAALDQARKASALPSFYWPLTAEAMAAGGHLSTAGIAAIDELIEAGGTSAILELIEGLQARAMLEAGSGRLDSAWPDLLAAYRLARFLQAAPRMGGRLQGGKALSMVGKGIRLMSAHPDLSVEQGRRILADMAIAQPTPEVNDILDQDERYAFLVMTFQAMQLQKNHVVDFNEMLREQNRWFNWLVNRPNQVPEEVKKQWADGTFYTPEGLRRPVVRALYRRLILRGPTFRQAYGQMAARETTTYVIDAFFECRKTCRVEDAKDCLTLLVVALATYKAEKGNYPDKLEDLSPALLSAVPEDPFPHRPFRYSRMIDGYLLYSVGPNMRDDGGKTVREIGKDDIGVRLLATED